MKNVQIPIEIFDNLCDFLLDGGKLSSEVIAFFEEKKEKIMKREVFSKYKASAPCSFEREHWRQVYIELERIRPGWQSSIEISKCDEELPPSDNI